MDGDHRELHVRTHSFPTRRSSELQAPNMRFGKSIGGGWIMPQMCIDRIAPAIGGGDFGDGAIDLADAMLGGRDRNDRAIVRRPESLAPADIDIVRDRKSTRLNSSH